MLVDYYGELEFGGRQKEGKGWFPTRREFLEQWNGGKRSFIFVVEKDRLHDFFADGQTGADKLIDAGKYWVCVKRKADKER